MGLQAVCVFCGSRPGRRPQYLETARILGRELARRGITLVFGAGSQGLMGAVAEDCLREGGAAVGVIPHFLLEIERPHPELTRLEVVETMHQRKARMLELADAFVVLPGGLGTLEELFEFWTGQLLGVHEKPVVCLDPEGFFQPLREWVEQLCREGFVAPEALGRWAFFQEIDRLFDYLETAVPAHATQQEVSRF